MRAYVTRGPSAMELVDVPAPLPGADEILVKVAFCSVCGSDVANYEGQGRRTPAGMILGHEVSGTVDKVGERVRDLRPGDRVALEPAIPCRRCWFCVRGQYHMCPNTVHLGSSTPGGFAEYLAIHELNAHRIPAGIPLRDAALLEPFGVCLAALRRARLQMGETVAIFGDGPFGAIFARLSVVFGARDVWVMGHHSWRLDRIRAPLITTINTREGPFLPAIQEATDGRGVDLVVVAADAPEVYPELLPAVRNQGRILAFTYPNDLVTLDMSRVHMRELEIIGSCRCPHTFESLIELIVQQRLKPAEFITATLPLEQLPAAFSLARGRSKELFKLVVEIAGETRPC